MTAMDIYSALGNVGEEMLEESELTDRRLIPKSIMYMTAAAACFAVLAAGLNFAFNDSGIAAPEQIEVMTIGETYSEPAYTQYTSAQTTETTRSVTVPLPLPVQTPDSVTAAATAPLSTTVDPDTFVEETLTDVPATAAPTVSETAYDEEETAIVPKWEDMSDLERYIYLQYNGDEYSITVNKFDESEITFLQNGRLYGFDEEHVEDCEGPVRRDMLCAFYKIKNINEDYMIAALTADGKYTAFINHRYSPDSLGNYLKDIDFSNRYKLTTIKSETHDLVDGEVDSRYYTYDLSDLQQAVERLLAENSDAVPEINPPPVMDRYLIICGNDTFPTVRICDGGYIGVLGKYFWIGEDQTESFMAYIEENSVKTEYDPRAGADPDEQMIPE